MRSAYSVLGIHGNATPGEIEIAFKTILATFTRERLATEPGGSGKLADVKEAYNVLRSPDMRAAHDRRLAQAVSSEPAVSSWVEMRYTEHAESRAGRWTLLLMLVTTLAVAGSWSLAQYRSQQGTGRAAAEAREPSAAELQYQKVLAHHNPEMARRSAEAEAQQRRLQHAANLARDRARQELRALTQARPVALGSID